MNYIGLITGFFTFFAIGLGFIYVIYLERYVGACVKRIVLILSILFLLSSLLYTDFLIASIIGISSGSLIWGVTEMDEQEERAISQGHKQYPNKICNRLKKSLFITKNKQ